MPPFETRFTYDLSDRCQKSIPAIFVGGVPGLAVADFFLHPPVVHRARSLPGLAFGVNRCLYFCGISERSSDITTNSTANNSPERKHKNGSICKHLQQICLRFSLLRQVYTAFDTHLDALGVYKLDTVGDAFVVVAGLDGFKSKEASLCGPNAAQLSCCLFSRYVFVI